MRFDRPVVLIAVSVSLLISVTQVSVAISPFETPADLSESTEAQALRLRKLKEIPYAQVEVEFGHDSRLSPRNDRCYFEAVVQRVFQRPDMLSSGMHIRVASDCTVERHRNVIEVRPGVLVDVDRSPLVRDLRRGALLQMRLRPADGPAKIFDTIGEVTVLKVFSDTPVDDSAGEESRVSHLNDYARLDGMWGPGTATLPAFPLRDAVVTYKNSTQPLRMFKAFYQSDTWRMRVEEADSRDTRIPVIIDDAFAATETWIWVRSATYAQQNTTWENRFGLVIFPWDRIFDAEGSDTIAGLACTRYYVHPPLTIGLGSYLEATHVCVTSDGIVLRHDRPDGSWSEAVRVQYERVTREQVTVPESFHKQPD
jgi:hypothetical protein